MPPVAEGQVLTGAQFAEPVRVETIKQVSPGAWEVGVSGLNTQKFRKVTLSAEDFKGLAHYALPVRTIASGDKRS